MRQILISIIILGLLSCTKTTQQTEIKTTDNVTNTVDNYSASAIYSSDESDSLLLSHSDFEKIILTFRVQGTKIKEKEYGGGDCWGRYKRFLLNGDTLTINKNSCGDYGFSNSQFLTKGDSISIVRKFEMQWSADSTETKFIVLEQIYTFKEGQLTINEKTKTILDWKGYDLKELPFKSRTTNGQQEYTDLKNELRELLTYELIED